MPVYYGKSVEEAIEAGLKELGITQENAEIKVIEEAKKGFLGINSKKAEVEVNAKKSDGERAKEFLSGLLALMNVNAECKLVSDDDGIVLDINADRSQNIIGYRGETLDAIQTITGAVANKGKSEYRRVAVDCQQYREKREETLKSLALKLADKAMRNGRKLILEPMSPYERRVIHSALADHTGVKTESEGKEPNRYVVIIPNELTSDEPEDVSFKGYRNGGDRKSNGNGRYGKTERYNNGGRNGNGYNKTKRYDRGDRTPRQPRPKTSGWGTFLGNSGNTNADSGEEKE